MKTQIYKNAYISTSRFFNFSTLLVRLKKRRYFNASYMKSKINFLNFLMVGGTATVGFAIFKVKETFSWLNNELTDKTGKIALFFDGITLPNSLSDEIKKFVFGTKKFDKQPESSIEGSSNFHDMLIHQFSELRALLKKANCNQDIYIPSIVVIGSQSSGKSSVLEKITGYALFPKGNNMVTKRPLELSLVRTENDGYNYATITYDDVSEITDDFSTVKNRILQLNTLPEHISILEDPISVTIYSSNVPDLIFVDLPGYIQVTTHKQPSSLSEQIHSLCEKYISKSNIILAISAADVDLANSEALKAARKVDPLGDRTIGVITKLDLVDVTNGIKLINNEDYFLKMGYTGIICSNMEGKSEIIRKKEEFYNQNCTNFGHVNLIKKMQNALFNSLTLSISTISRRLGEEIDKMRYVLKLKYGDRFVSYDTFYNNYITQLKSAIRNALLSLDKSSLETLIKTNLDLCLIHLMNDKISDNYKSYDSFNQVITGFGIGKISLELLMDLFLYRLEDNMKNDFFLNFDTCLDGRILKEVREYVFNEISKLPDQIETIVNSLKLSSGTDKTSQEWAAKDLKDLLNFYLWCLRDDLFEYSRHKTQKQIKRLLYLYIKRQELSKDDERFAEIFLEKYELIKSYRNRCSELDSHLNGSLANSSDEFLHQFPDAHLSFLNKRYAEIISILLKYKVQTIQENLEANNNLFLKGLNKKDVISCIRNSTQIEKQIKLQETMEIYEQVALRLKNLKKIVSEQID